MQGCPEATVHGDIASYSGHLHRLLFCKIKTRGSIRWGIRWTSVKIWKPLYLNLATSYSYWPLGWPLHEILGHRHLTSDQQTCLWKSNSNLELCWFTHNLPWPHLFWIRILVILYAIFHLGDTIKYDFIFQIKHNFGTKLYKSSKKV